VQLAYAGFLCWADAKAAAPSLSQEQLLDYIRAVSYRFWLPAGDIRSIGVNIKSIRERFPDLFRIESLPLVGPERGQFVRSQLEKPGSFGGNHRFYNWDSMTIRRADESDYLDYWIERSEDEVRDFVSNPRILAALDAMNNELLSFEGVLEKAYGPDFS